VGLFDVVSPQVCELGKIKIGGKGPVQQGKNWRAPKKWDHFVVTTMSRDAAGDLMPDVDLMKALVAQGYADEKDGKIRRLPVSLLSNNIEDVIQASYVWYNGKKVAARSDGVTLTKFHDGKNPIVPPVEVPWDASFLDKVDGKGNKYFKMHLTFNCIVRVKNARWGGVYKLRTTSVITASKLLGSLLEIKNLMSGVLRGLPLELVLTPVQVSPNGQTSTVYVCHCELVGEDLMELQQAATIRAQHELANAKEIKQAQLQYRKLITAPGFDESPEEQADVASEFAADDETNRQASTVSTPAKVQENSDPLLDKLGLDANNEPAKEEPKLAEGEVANDQEQMGDAFEGQ